MTNYDTQYPVRVPNLPLGKIVDDNGYPTPEELTFRQALVTLLQTLFGNEGLVMPTQTTTNITSIVGNTALTPGATATTYTCLPGTMIYNSTNNTFEVMLFTNTTDGIPARYLVTTTVI